MLECPAEADVETVLALADTGGVDSVVSEQREDAIETELRLVTHVVSLVSEPVTSSDCAVTEASSSADLVDEVANGSNTLLCTEAVDGPSLIPRDAAASSKRAFQSAVNASGPELDNFDMSDGVEVVEVASSFGHEGTVVGEAVDVDASARAANSSADGGGLAHNTYGTYCSSV